MGGYYQGWNDFWTNIGTVLDSAAADIQQGWNDAWTAVSDFVSDIWEGITDTIETAINGIIGLVNGMISAVVGGVNAVIGVLERILGFDVPEWAQGALGARAGIGFNIDPITAPQIPYLAQGAVIPANHEFLAVLGDQTNGTNVEAPLETIQEALAEVYGRPGRTGHHDPLCRATWRELARLLNPYIDKENNRRGAQAGEREVCTDVSLWMALATTLTCCSLKRTADFLTSTPSARRSGDLERELIGVYFNYKLELGPGIEP